jgi:glycine/D-amino acid oxidase-like deaminating enzyme
MSIWLQKELPSKTQVVVIGGGIAGVSVAYHLAANEVDVVLLEAGEIACRATGRNDGQLLIGTITEWYLNSDRMVRVRFSS